MATANVRLTVDLTETVRKVAAAMLELQAAVTRVGGVDEGTTLADRTLTVVGAMLADPLRRAYVEHVRMCERCLHRGWTTVACERERLLLSLLPGLDQLTVMAERSDE